MGNRNVGDCILTSALGAVLIVACMAWSAPSWAHHRTTSQALRANGISIPNLSHGQMGVIADNFGAIVDVAEQETAPDATTERLLSYVNLQYFFCVRGLVPGSLTDEQSPFNECGHAYLAGARALLMHLNELPERRPAVQDLVRKIQLEMLSNSTSLTLCRYSDEPFNSAEVMMPHWGDIPSHPTTLLTFGGLATALVGCGWLLSRRRAGADGADLAAG